MNRELSHRNNQIGTLSIVQICLGHDFLDDAPAATVAAVVAVVVTV